MLGFPEFHHDLVQKYIAVFGSLFDDIEVFRNGKTSGQQERVKVPLTYASRDKVIAFAEKQFKTNQTAIATIVPRISFYMVSMYRDTQRQLNKFGEVCTVGGVIRKRVPYNFEFEVNILTKTETEGLRIVEQILPFFDPSITVNLKPFTEDPSFSIPVPITFNGTPSRDDTYQGNAEERRTVVWTLNFTLQGFLYGPLSTNSNIIKKVIIRYPEYNEDSETYPGLTLGGVGTTDPAQTIDYKLINSDDPYEFIIEYGAINE